MSLEIINLPSVYPDRDYAGRVRRKLIASIFSRRLANIQGITYSNIEK
jgi:hypothetical protein